MRIVGGEHRGRKLSEPRDGKTTRPTADRVREACASVLESALPEGIAGSSVLDAFAGTGAFGLELLSRGAARATFVDADRDAAALVRKNVELLRMPPSRATVGHREVGALAQRGRVPGAPFDVVLLDPPYAFGAEPVSALLAALASHGLLAQGAVALFERSSATPALEAPGFERLREKRYGKTSVDVLRRTGA